MITLEFCNVVVGNPAVFNVVLIPILKVTTVDTQLLPISSMYDTSVRARLPSKMSSGLPAKCKMKKMKRMFAFLLAAVMPITTLPVNTEVKKMGKIPMGYASAKTARFTVLFLWITVLNHP